MLNLMKTLHQIHKSSRILPHEETMQKKFAPNSSKALGALYKKHL
jgi:hypothetical protein